MKRITDTPDNKTIYLWNMLGSVGNAGLSVLLLMIVTRLLTAKEADIFSIGWAVAQLMVTIGTFQVRLYQATDVEGKYDFSQYFKFRVFTVILMMIGTVGYVWMKDYSQEKILIILLICLYKVVDAFSDVYQGWFQLKERLDLAGKAIALRSLYTFICFGIAIFMKRDLLFGCIVLLVSSLVCFLCLDMRYFYCGFREKRREKTCYEKQWLWTITKTCFPLFMNSFLMMVMINIPKIAIDNVAAQREMADGIQAAYGIIFMPASVVTLAFLVFRPMITQLAIYWYDKNYQACNKLIMKMFVLLMGISGIVILGGFFMGIPVLSLLYGVDLTNYKRAFMILLIGGVINTLAYVFDNVLTVIRKQFALVIAYGIASIYSICVGNWMVDKYEMAGAAVVYASTMVLLFIVTFILFIKYYFTSRES